MRDVVLRGTGTRANLTGYSVFGKTGTAQKLDPATGTYSADKYVSSFLCGAPAAAPRVLVLVVVDEPSVERLALRRNRRRTRGRGDSATDARLFASSAGQFCRPTARRHRRADFERHRSGGARRFAEIREFPRVIVRRTRCSILAAHPCRGSAASRSPRVVQSLAPGRLAGLTLCPLM